MTYNLSDKELAAVSALPMRERYAHAIKRIADLQQVWSLHNADGWVLSGDNVGREVISIWSHPRYAEVCAQGTWSDCQPKAIELSVWMDAWLPGIQRDRKLICVFMTPTASGATSAAEVLRRDLEEELERLE